MAFLELDKPIVLQPHSRLDLEGGTQLQKEIAAIASHPNQLWVLDMAQVDFIDSSGLVALIASLNSARQHQCRLVICNLKTSVRLILEITQLDQAFEIFDHEEDLWASLIPKQAPKQKLAAA